jgi:glutathione S-transferase
MKLYGSLTSPFARKVRMMALETGLSEQIELITSAPTPVSQDAALVGKNPLGKIPVLELADGSWLYDSRVICEYLDSLHTGTPLIPAAGPERWRVLRCQALADGILDAGILMRYETVIRPQELQWREWIQAEADKVIAGLTQLEQEVDGLGEGIDIGQIAMVCAIGWLQFRGSLDVLLKTPPARPSDLLQDLPRLASWYARFARRPSLQATEPPA